MTQSIDKGQQPSRTIDYTASWMSEVERAKLQEFDRSLRTVKEADAAISVAGVLSGVKPGALIEVIPKATWPQDIKGFGLHYAPINLPFGEHRQSGVIARDGAVLDDLWQLCSVHAPYSSEKDIRLGELLGFPATATEHYLRRLSTVGTPWELPAGQDILGEKKIEDYFCQLVLSPDHYEEEMEAYVRPLQRATQELMPHTYEILERSIISAKVLKATSIAITTGES